MTHEEAIKKIALQLDGIDKSDLTKCEMNIAKILIVGGWAEWAHGTFEDYLKWKDPAGK